MSFADRSPDIVFCVVGLLRVVVRLAAELPVFDLGVDFLVLTGVFPVVVFLVWPTFDDPMLCPVDPDEFAWFSDGLPGFLRIESVIFLNFLFVLFIDIDKIKIKIKFPHACNFYLKRFLSLKHCL